MKTMELNLQDMDIIINSMADETMLGICNAVKLVMRGVVIC